MKKLYLVFVFAILLLTSISAFSFINKTNAYYKLDELSGVVVDSTGNFSATNTGATQGAVGKLGTAYNFTRVESDNINYSGNLSITSYPFSIQAWVKQPSITNPGEQTIIDLGNTQNDDNDWAFGIDTSGNLFILARTTSGSDSSASTTKINDSTYHHIVVVFNASNNRTLYLDGNAILNQSTSIAMNFTNYFCVGASATTAGCTSNFYNGSIDEIGVFGRLLNITDVRELYNSGNGLAYGLNLTVNSPIDNYNSTNATIVFNISVINSTSAVENVSLIVDDVVVSSNTTRKNGTYLFTQSISKGNHNWSIITRDNSSVQTSTPTRNLNIDWIFLNNVTYESSVSEGSQTVFTGVFTTNGTVITIGNLSYNGTGNIGTITQSGTLFTINKTINAPTVTGNTNVSWFWNITLSDGYVKNFSSLNQTVVDFSVDNCTTNSAVLYNFTIVNEETQTALSKSLDNTSGQLNLQIYSLDRTILLQNFSSLYNITNPFSVCLSSNLSSGENYVLDLQLQYSASSYATEFYHIQNRTINTSSFPTNITLYDLASANSQEFKITFKDSSFLAVQDALVQIQRKYINEGTYKTIEIPKTDAKGETLAHLVLNDVIYTFIIIKNGEILGTFNDVRAQCQNPTIQECAIPFNSFSSYIQPEDYTSLEDFDFTLTFNKSTRTVTSVFTIPSGSVDTVSLNVTLLDQLGNTSACSQQITTSAGTLSCTVPLNLGNGTIIAYIYKGGILQGQGAISLAQDPADIYGANIVFLSILMFLTLIGIGMTDEPMVLSFFILLGVIFAIGLNIISTAGIIGYGATTLWLIIAIILIWIKGGNR